MFVVFAFLAGLLPVFAESVSHNSGLHFPIHRRGGRFAHHEAVNLTKLHTSVSRVGSKYSRTCRAVDSNRLVRRWRDGSEEATHLLDGTGLSGGWYAEIKIGEPPQKLEVEIDMLSPDFYTIMTTSGRGSKYDTFASSTHNSKEKRVHPLCQSANDIFHLPAGESSVRIDIPTCNPPKSSRHTLFSSGTIIGLSPSKSLSRISSPHLIDQLLASGVIQHHLWSLTLLDSEVGILSFGGTIAKEIEEAKIRTEIELQHVDDPSFSTLLIEQQIRNKLNFAIPPDSQLDQHFKWISIQGAASGWWTTLMTGVWVNGAKVLKNQPVLLDVNCPFILAPPLAARSFYEAIGGARPLDEILSPFTSTGLDNEYTNTDGRNMSAKFFAFPCLNAISIAFEMAGWSFPVMSGQGTGADAVHGPSGGRFSLGKAISNGTGYCVGIVVETSMGLQSRSSGMQDTWVLGEPFFRGLGVAFDMRGGKDGKSARIGLRSY